MELRFFGGLTVEETTEVVGISPSTVKHDRAYTRAWLFREIAFAPAVKLKTPRTTACETRAVTVSQTSPGQTNLACGTMTGVGTPGTNYQASPDGLEY